MLRARFALASVMVIGSLGLGASCNRSNTGNGTMAQGPDVRQEAPAPDHAGPSATPAPGGVTEVPGLDLAALSQAERERFWAVASDELSPCGDPHSLAVCGRDRTCTSCMPALRFLARRVSDGFPREQLGDLVRARYARSAVQTIHFDGAAVRGSATAPVTLVEFSDYECPHCGRAAPILRDIEREFEGRLRVVHMHFPLSGHIHALPASRAAVAAGRQNKFWEYHDLLFANQHNLEPADLDRFAQQLGLDMNRFHADMQAPETEALIQANRREGERLEIDGTPTIYIDGRRYPPAMPFDRPQLREWIQEEIDNPPAGGGAAAPAPSNAAPAAAAAPAHAAAPAPAAPPR
jgi:2-hydroxychromene-2-carboxylate isomerase